MNQDHSVLPVAKIFELHKSICNDIIIPDTDEVSLDTADKKFSAFCHRMAVSSFSDLQLLRIVPNNIEEGQIKSAISKDDTQAYKLTRKNYNGSLYNCGCQDCHTASTKVDSTISAIYKNIRKDSNFHLMNLLSEAYNQRLDISSTVLKDTYKWITAINTKPYVDISIFLVRDIIVNYNATFTIKPNLNSLLARNIIIKKSGKIVVNSSYLRIRCDSIQGEDVKYYRPIPFYPQG